MLRRDTQIGRSASMLHKVMGVVAFVLSAVLLVVCWSGKR